MNCIDCKDFTCLHRSKTTDGGSCYYESGEQKEKLLTMTAEASLHYVDWSSFRRDAAKDFISGMLANVSPAANQWTTPEIVSAAIEIADELIKRLKDEK